MKNLFFTFFLMLSATFAFSLNSVPSLPVQLTEDVGKCSYSITTTVTYADGSTFSYDTPYTTDADSLKDCINKANEHVENLNNPF